MTSENLSDEEKWVVKECLLAISSGNFLDDGEFHTLMGLTLAETHLIAIAYPNIQEACLESPSARNSSNDNLMAQLNSTAINNSLNNLIGYQKWSSCLWTKYISVSLDEVERIFKKWRR
ncbi:hypothetical protein [uncultured Kiloniella sp.]|uniref:hypothetical protein n=1 Tax=Kiloniella sp. TaxID=1938587 RepID=UPI0026258888|nr:hypothetical protein [uncultured Kiloniella sp.]